MKPLKLYLISLFCLLSLNIVIGQSDYREGYIIDNSNDTTFGYIDYLQANVNIRKCFFRKQLNDSVLVFNPQQIKAFRVVNHELIVSKSKDNNAESEKIFMECLFDGIVNLYSYKNISNTYYFIETEKGEFIELLNEDIEKMQNGKRYVLKSKRYIGVLKYAFKEYPEIYNRIEKTSLEHKSLIKLASIYHEKVCPDQLCVIFVAKPKFFEINVGPQVGVNSFILDEKVSNNLYYLVNSDFSTTLSPTVGVYAEFLFPTISKNLKLTYENNIAKYTTNTSHESLSYTTIIQTTASIRNLDFSHNLSLIYEIPLNKSSLSIGSGLFINKHLSSQFEGKVVHIRNGNVTGNYTHDYSNFLDNNSLTGLNFGIGYKLNKKMFDKFKIQLNYSVAKDNHIATNNSNILVNQYVNLLVRYDLVKLNF